LALSIEANGIKLSREVVKNVCRQSFSQYSLNVRNIYRYALFSGVVEKKGVELVQSLKQKDCASPLWRFISESGSSGGELQDIFQFHILSKLNSADIKFLYCVNSESKAAILCCKDVLLGNVTSTSVANAKDTLPVLGGGGEFPISLCLQSPFLIRDLSSMSTLIVAYGGYNFSGFRKC